MVREEECSYWLYILLHLIEFCKYKPTNFQELEYWEVYFKSNNTEHHWKFTDAYVIMIIIIVIVATIY